MLVDERTGSAGLEEPPHLAYAQSLLSPALEVLAFSDRSGGPASVL